MKETPTPPNTAETGRALTLPSGKIARIKEGKGRDLLQAQRVAKSAEEMLFALLAELVTFEGKRLVLEEVLELPLKDVLALQQAVVGDFLPSPALRPSSTSAESPAGDTVSSKR